jgi:alpha-D-ribose 1-methylphosphonate 5-triphosphate synthase subunit PhnG
LSNRRNAYGDVTAATRSDVANRRVDARENFASVRRHLAVRIDRHDETVDAALRRGTHSGNLAEHRGIDATRAQCLEAVGVTMCTTTSTGRRSADSRYAASGAARATWTPASVPSVGAMANMKAWRGVIAEAIGANPVPTCKALRAINHRLSQRCSGAPYRERVNRTTRCETLAQVSPDAAQRLAHSILDGSLGEVQIITPPTVGMLMARAVDGARAETFNLGEVVVSEARVSIAGHQGWSMVMGANAEHALAAAIVDAGIEAGHASARPITAELARLAAELEQRLTAEIDVVAPTRVRFETF